MSGFVYAASNYAYPDLVKIGMTERVPEIREIELGSHEGTPGKVKIQYYAFIAGNARSIEELIHKRLSRHHHSKEWFRIDINTAVNEIKRECKDILKYEEFFFESTSSQELKHDENTEIKDTQRALTSEYRDFYIVEDQKIYNHIISEIQSTLYDCGQSLAKSKLLKSTGVDIDYSRNNPWKPGTMGKLLLKITKISAEGVQANNEWKVRDICDSIVKNDMNYLGRIKNSYKPMMSIQDYVFKKNNNQQVLFWDRNSVIQHILNQGHRFSPQLYQEFLQRLQVRK